MWVVPFNPFLSLRYNCHIHVEVCSSVAAVKYLYKYVYKGHDRAMVEVHERAGGAVADGQQAAQVVARDEVKAHLDGRYVSAGEAVHRLLQLPLHQQHPNVVRLQVHLPHQQTVVVPVVEDKGEMAEAASAAVNAGSRTTPSQSD
jgi:hypothetical protein